jgi:alpha-L-rhamnosidase
MRRLLLTIPLLGLFSAPLDAFTAESPAAAGYLRCEYRVDPLGIGVVNPRLSWEMHDARRGARQSAYQVLVATSPEKLARDEADLWDSGKVESGQSSQVAYAGKSLASRTRCFWKVRLWDAQGEPSAYSEPAAWSLGLLDPGDVKAKWIGLDGPMVHAAKGKAVSFDGCRWIWTAEPGVDAQKSAPKGPRFFRGSVTIPPDRKVTQARFLIAADDQFELFVNGKPAGRGTAWNEPVLATLTNHLTPGKNSLAVVVTNGAPSPAGLVGKLIVELDQGEPIIQRIDTSWKAGTALQPGWNGPDFDDSAWGATAEVAPMGATPWGELNTSGLDVLACPMFRKEFTAEKPVRRATVYASALGIYQLHVNGKPVGDDYLTPGWTDYRKRVYYNTYDVTDLVHREGASAIGAVLSAGWYAGAIGWKSERFHYGNRPRVFVQLELELEDGTIQTISTDGTWKTAFGPYVEGEFLAGETYDARLEMPGWSEPSFDDAAWGPVAVADSIEARLQAYPGVPVRETGRVEPVGIAEHAPGVYVVDLGQNFAGFARLKAKGPAGARVKMRFAEMLNPDGSIYTTNLRTARATDTYVLKGEGEEVWQPRFTFHGFRYIEVTGYPGTLTRDAITGIAINSATPMVGSFECSSPMVNQLYSNITWTQRANFISVPTDCPQRDERMGWTGDAEVFLRAASYNADVAAFFTKWLVDLEDAQRDDGAVYVVAPQVVTDNAGVAAWSDAAVVCPWTIYQVYGDARLLEKHYGMMVRWVEYCRAHSKDLLRPAEGYGDWLSIQADTPKDVLGTAFFAESTKLLARAARVLGKESDATKYEQLFDDIKAAFNRAYVADHGRIKGNTQTCYVLALWFELLPEEKREAAVRYLVDDIRARDTHLSTGFVGTSFLMPTLSAVGQNQLAYQLLLGDTFPSWGYSIKHGATSIWERWDGWTAEKGFQDPGMNSFAHYSFGAVARWMFQTVAGIDTDGPGFQKLVIRPQPADGLSWVKASYRSPHGRVATEWKTKGGRFTLDVTVPANTTAKVYLPAEDAARVTEAGKPAAEAEGVKLLGKEPGAVVFEVGAGQYRFVVR